MILPKVGAMALMLSLTLLVAHKADNRPDTGLARPLDAIPQKLGDFVSSRGPELGEHISGVLKASSYLSREYQCAGGSLQLLIIFYAHQHAGESMHSPKVCLPGGGWEISDYGKMSVTAGGTPVKINQVQIQKNLERMRVLYWYQNRQRILSDEYLGKIFLVKDTLWNGSTGGSIVRITFRDRPGLDLEAARFASLLIPEMERCLGSAR